MTLGNSSAPIMAMSVGAEGSGRGWHDGAGVSQKKGDGRGFNNTGEMRWSETNRLDSSGRTDRPSITPGRSADEAWAPGEGREGPDR